jgi:hypothetical protein
MSHHNREEKQTGKALARTVAKGRLVVNEVYLLVRSFQLSVFAENVRSNLTSLFFKHAALSNKGDHLRSIGFYG